MATKETGAGGGGKRPTGSTGRNRNAYCSFCRKSYLDVGPLVEGPGDVYICGDCTALCQSIIDQEKSRHTKPVSDATPEAPNIRQVLDRFIDGFEHAKIVLIDAALLRLERK